MAEIEFLVEGSAPEPYRVTFLKDRNTINAYCTCPAGENGLHCKHRFAILAGDGSAIVSENKAQLATVKAWLPGTELENAFVELGEAEHDYDAAIKRLATAKRKIAKAMGSKRKL